MKQTVNNNSKPHILVVERNELVRGFVKDVLEFFDYEVTLAANYDSARQIFDNTEKRFSLVFVDDDYGRGGNGLGFVAHILAQDSKQPMALMTAEDLSALKDQKAWKPDLPIIGKPFSTKELKTFIEKALPQPVDESAKPVSEKQALLVDDEEHILKLCESLLKRLGYEVTACSDGYQAFNALGNNTHYDLLVTDKKFPGNGEGYGVINEAKRLYPDMPVVMMTGSPDPGEKRLLAQDNVIMLAKPFEIMQFTGAVDMACFAVGKPNNKRDTALDRRAAQRAGYSEHVIK